MPTTFQKLNFKGQPEIVVINVPASFEPDLDTLRGVDILRDLKGMAEIAFSLAFVTTKKEIDTLAKSIGTKARGDAIVWFAYPKGTSTRYKSDVNRDWGWDSVINAGFETVRAVALDEDWSALRCRCVEFVREKRPEAQSSPGTPRRAHRDGHRRGKSSANRRCPLCRDSLRVRYDIHGGRPSRKPT